MFLSIVGVFFGVVFLYFFLLTLLPFEEPEQVLELSTGPPPETASATPWSRKDVNFSVKGTKISAWLYLPAASGPSPCVVMGNGLGGTKRVAGLERYAVRFVEAGLAVLVFDYRFFGESQGEPRQLIWIPHQLEDYRAAVEFVRGHESVDPDRVALWGTSLSGGHVIVAASQDSRIACVIAQCPGVDGRASAKRVFERKGLGYGLRLVMHGQRDFMRSLVGLSPHRIPIVAEDGGIGLMSSAKAVDFAGQFAPPDYINKACARIVIRGDKYRPVKYADRVRCPVLFQVCEKDEIVPLEASKDAENRMRGHVEAHYYPITHFDIYSGENFERAVGDQVDFLVKHLLSGSSPMGRVKSLV